jgi:hypothetical protein
MGEATKVKAKRREILKLFGLGGAASAAALLAAEKPAAAASAEPGETGGYRESAHVKRYYELAKF